jgi:hypothetical protein
MVWVRIQGGYQGITTMICTLLEVGDGLGSTGGDNTLTGTMDRSVDL